MQVAADHVDTYLTWGEPPADVAAKIAAAKAVAATRGRAFSYGIRLHVRVTSKEAWAAAEDLIGTSTTKRSRRRRRLSRVTTRWVSSGWRACIRVAATSWR